MINNKPPEPDCILAVEAGGLFLFLHYKSATMKIDEYWEVVITRLANLRAS